MEDLEAVVAYLREEGGCCNSLIRCVLQLPDYALLLACGTRWRGLEAASGVACLGVEGSCCKERHAIRAVQGERVPVSSCSACNLPYFND